MSDTIRIGCPTTFRSRSERRERYRLGNEFAAQFYHPQASSTLNLKIIDANGDSVLCHTEVIENNVHVFPDEMDERGCLFEKIGGYSIVNSYARIEDFTEILKFYYYDSLVLDKQTLTIERLDRLIHAAHVLTQMNLYNRLLTIRSRFQDCITVRLNSSPNNSSSNDDEFPDRSDEIDEILRQSNEVTAASFADLVNGIL